MIVIFRYSQTESISVYHARAILSGILPNYRYERMNMTRVCQNTLFCLLTVFLSTHPAVAKEIPFADPSETGFSPQHLQKIQPAMQTLIDSRKFAGVLTLIARKGKIVHFETAGLRDIKSSKPMTKDTIFRIYSMTKPITSVAIMMLYEEGKLKLNDPLSKFIPEFANTKVYAGGGSQNPTLIPPKRPITIADLLSHTAGLTYGIFSNTPVDTLYNKANLWSVKSSAKYAQKAAQLPLRLQPGTRWIYSIATDILGLVVEAASGLTLGEFFSQRIFVPLNMVDTTFLLPQAKQDRLATVYKIDKTGTLVPGNYRDNLKPGR